MQQNVSSQPKLTKTNLASVLFKDPGAGFFENPPAPEEVNAFSIESAPSTNRAPSVGVGVLDCFRGIGKGLSLA